MHELGGMEGGRLREQVCGQFWKLLSHGVHRFLGLGWGKQTGLPWRLLGRAPGVQTLTWTPPSQLEVGAPQASAHIGPLG